MQLNLIKLSFFIFFIIMPNITLADKRLTTYFSNDSVNGIQVSDAYETHNMGLIFDFDEKFISLDLGIVSPDMHIYKNQFRVANRSFGEIITLSAGSRNSQFGIFRHEFYGQIKSTNKFGIDRMQDFMHKFLALQPVNEVNDLVRMPADSWIGIGGKLTRQPVIPMYSIDTYGLNYYFGTDRVEVSPYAHKFLNKDKLDMFGEFGLRAIMFDDIISAPPILAKHREIIPYVELGLTLKYLGLTWYLKDKFSLPTIKSDNGIFGVLTAGVRVDLK